MNEITQQEMERQAFETISAGEPEWLRRVREQAWQLRAQLELPPRSQHRWRYTNPRRLLFPAGTPLRPTAARSEHPPAHGEGLVVMDLATAARELPELLQRHLGHVLPADDSLFAALHAALWSGGLLVRVPAGTHPTQTLRTHTDLSGAEGVLLPRTLIVVERGATLTLVDEVSSPAPIEAGAMLHRSVEIVLEDGAGLNYVSIQDAPAGSVLHTTTAVHLAAGARLDYVFGSFGGGVVKADLRAELLGRGAESNVFGLVYGRGRQRFDHHTVQRLHAPDCRSGMDVRAVLADEARSAATGLLWIGEQGERAEAWQENRNLLLSERARAVSLPELEIMTDDVQAKHGATVGPVDETMLYYLASRGLPREEAIRLVVTGFFEPLIEKVPVENCRQALRQLVRRQLEG
ncbi:MAG: Fe-S cluster assembly protein SufD [Acidobacteriota bacterium]|nr:Fe-S cluster assembly protein SufD [Acidobacteriota bacterium]MDQ7086741.1 Fe-S cluster assembly protein SufD [Acidobacteriota bacterium]